MGPWSLLPLMESWLSVGDAEATCRLEAYRLALSVAQVGRGRGGDRTSRMGTPDTCSQAVGRLLLGFLSMGLPRDLWGDFPEQ